MWEVPKIRELVQASLHGMRWMCKFDFISMFWQIELHNNSKGLFCFYAGELGTYQFNRVAMGALNSSLYTQKMVTGMFDGIKRSDGRPLLNNGLIVQTDTEPKPAVTTRQALLTRPLRRRPQRPQP